MAFSCSTCRFVQHGLISNGFSAFSAKHSQKSAGRLAWRGEPIGRSRFRGERLSLPQHALAQQLLISCDESSSYQRAAALDEFIRFVSTKYGNMNSYGLASLINQD